MAVYDDGTGNGTELYVGGFFREAGGPRINGDCLPENGCVEALSIAKWNPRTQTWSAVGAGPIHHFVNALAVFDDDAIPMMAL